MTEINKYNTGKIYKIWSPSRDDLIYYGSTIEKLNRRLVGHKGHYKLYKAGKYHNTSAFKIFDECDDYRIDLVENYSCSNREELNSREGEYIKNNMCVNKFIPGRTDKEYRIDNKEKIKKYYDEHKDQIKEQVKQYQKANREKINDRQRELRKLKKISNTLI